MISSEFAPNESREDAVLAFSLLFQPWKWRRGKETNNLKRRLKSRFFSSDSHISFFLSARGALYQYLKTISFPTNAEVLVSGSTPITCLLPILEHQLRPIYVDINKEDLSMNVRDLKKKYSPKAKLLILRHPYGITPKDRKEILVFAKEKKLTVVEDLSQGFDSDIFKKKHFTSTLIMSFSRSSAVSSVLGGAIVIRGKRNVNRLREVEKNIPNASFWLILQIIFYKMGSVIIKKTYRFYLGKLVHFIMKHFNLIPSTLTRTEAKGQFDHKYLKTYPNICVLFLMKQLDRFNDVSAKRKKAVFRYSKHFTSFCISNIPLSYYPLVVDSPLIILKKLKPQNMTLAQEQYTIQNEQFNHHSYYYKKKSCPIAEQVVPQIIKLPTNISKRDSEKLITTLKKVISTKK